MNRVLVLCGVLALLAGPAAALALLESGAQAEACEPLHAALLHADGASRPRDLVSGAAATDVAEAIRTLRGHLACTGEESP